MEEFVVIGAGLAGAATAWRLSARGHQVTVLEQYTPGNRQGSSHGSARILRYAYVQQLYAGLVLRARSGWEQLQHESGVSLITSTGSLDHGSLRPVGQIAEVLTTLGLDHEVLSAGNAQARWPELRFSTEVLWQPDAGVIDAVSSVEAMLGLATRTGNAQVFSDWPVSRLESIDGGYRVLGPNGARIDAANVVVSAGGWLPTLLANLPLPSGFVEAFPPLQVREEYAVHFPYRAVTRPALRPWPTFICKEADLQVYGLPGGRDAEFRGLKVAQFNGGRVIDSPQSRNGIVDSAARQRLVDFADRALSGVIPTPYAETTCLFTSTPTEDFVIDRADRITVVSACSGHGGKFAPLLGELAADLALGQGEVPDEFRLAAHAGSRSARS